MLCFLVRHRRQPLGVLRLFTPNRFKINALKFFCDRPTHATTNSAIVELADRHHLGRGTGEKRLICDINFIAGDTFFFDRQALIRGDAQDTVACDSLQTRGQLWRIQDAIPNQKKVLATALCDISLIVQE